MPTRCSCCIAISSASFVERPSSPGHPQTCGKLERFHQTFKGWLEHQPLPETLAELQGVADRFVDYYNVHRPHRALAGDTPQQRWQATPPVFPGPALASSPRSSLHQVDGSGTCSWGQYRIGVGQAFTHQTVLIVARGDQLSIYGAGSLIRTLTLDPTRKYQPTGKPKGRRRTIGPCT